MSRRNSPSETGNCTVSKTHHQTQTSRGQQKAYPRGGETDMGHTSSLDLREGPLVTCQLKSKVTIILSLEPSMKVLTHV